MKSEESITKKQRKVGGCGMTKHQCGTLSYLAECRGHGQKADSSRLPNAPDGLSRIVRKRPVDK